MHTTSVYHRLAIAAVTTTLLLGIGFPAAARAAEFPSLNRPATKEMHPGKFVWAELFTDDVPAAAAFYSGVFGWTAIKVKEKADGEVYTILSNGRRPIAGLREHANPAMPHASRWIDFISVADIGATLAQVTQAGGEVRAPARAFPRLGVEAIITDDEGSPVGLLQSSSGDIPDVEPAVGEWNWFHLFTKKPEVAADFFYKRVFNYDVAPDSRSGKKGDWFLSSGDFNRGGISFLGDSPDAKPGWLGVIRVASLDDTLSRVPSLGGQVLVAPHDASFGSRSAVIADPTGGVLAVVEYLPNSNPVNNPANPAAHP